jgi:hypothetical protein
MFRRHPRIRIMSKLAAIALIVATLAACSSMSGPSPSGSMDGSNTASVNPPRSPGEGPSFTPYGAAGH